MRSFEDKTRLVLLASLARGAHVVAGRRRVSKGGARPRPRPVSRPTIDHSVR